MAVDSKLFFTGEEWDDIYTLPPNAFKVWMYHYRCESDGRESWPSEDLICYKLRICRDTLADNRKWLKQHGWLIQLSEAYRGHNPTFRTERGWLPDNAEKPSRDEIKKQRKNTDALNASEKYRRLVSSSGSGSGSVSSSVSLSGSGYPPTGGRQENPKPQEEEKTNTNTNPKTKKLRVRGKPLAPDGTAWSDWDSHDLAWKNEKFMELGLMPRPKSEPRGEETPRAKSKGKLRRFLDESDYGIKINWNNPCDYRGLECVGAEHGATETHSGKRYCRACLAEALEDSMPSSDEI
jgi:hypothetical protein